MKKYITASLFIFVAITFGVAIVGLVSLGSDNQAVVGSNINEINPTNNITGVSPSVNTFSLSKIELTKHNSINNCWLLISGKIYDVTTFLNQHPGNASTILPNCGTDATVAFDTRGGTGSHSSSAFAMLAAYYIGDLNQAVTISTTNPTTPPIANPNSTPSKQRGDDD